MRATREVYETFFSAFIRNLRPEPQPMIRSGQHRQNPSMMPRKSETTKKTRVTGFRKRFQIFNPQNNGKCKTASLYTRSGSNICWWTPWGALRELHTLYQWFLKKCLMSCHRRHSAQSEWYIIWTLKRVTGKKINLTRWCVRRDNF